MNDSNIENTDSGAASDSVVPAITWGLVLVSLGALAVTGQAIGLRNLSAFVSKESAWTATKATRESELTHLDKELADLEKERTGLNKSMDRLHGNETASKSKIRSLEADKTRLTESRDILQREVDLLEKDRENLTQLKKEAEKALDQKINLQTTIEGLKTEISGLEGTQKGLAAKKDELQKSVDQNKERLKFDRDEITDARAELEEIATEIRAKRVAATDELRKLDRFYDARLAALKKELNAHEEKNKMLMDNINAQADKQKRDLKANVDKWKKRTAELDKLKDEIDKANEDKTNAIEELGVEQKKRDDLLKKQTLIKDEIKRLNKDLPALRLEEALLKRLGPELDDATAAKAKLEGEVKARRKSRNELIEKVEELRTKHNELEEARTDLGKKIQKLEEKFESLERTAEKLEEKLNKEVAPPVDTDKKDDTAKPVPSKTE